jgi:hypothetical protein
LSIEASARASASLLEAEERAEAEDASDERAEPGSAVFVKVPPSGAERVHSTSPNRMS